MPACEYTTPVGLATYDLVYRDIELHTQYAHSDLRPATSGVGANSGPKAEKLPKPNITEGATDSDWVYFSDQWKRYKRSTNLNGQAAVDQLWACCGDTLARAVYDSGVDSHTDEDTLMSSIKKLAVWAQNKLVNVTNFLGMGQDKEETIGCFSARLKGQSAVCDFFVVCSASSYSNKTSYVEKMVAHQLVRGLSETEIQEQVLVTQQPTLR